MKRVGIVASPVSDTGEVHDSREPTVVTAAPAVPKSDKPKRTKKAEVTNEQDSDG